jgi:hypothetical protein
MVSAEFISTDARVKVRALGYSRLGEGILRNDTIVDVEGLSTEEGLIDAMLNSTVEDAVLLIQDIQDSVDGPPEFNEREFFRSFPVELGTPVTLIVPNPLNPGEPVDIQRITKMFIGGGDIQLDSFSFGVGFRYRF